MITFELQCIFNSISGQSSYRLKTFRRQWSALFVVSYGFYSGEREIQQQQQQQQENAYLSIALENYSALAAMIIFAFVHILRLPLLLLYFQVICLNRLIRQIIENWAVWLWVQWVILNDFIQPIPIIVIICHPNECWMHNKKQCTRQFEWWASG